MGSYHCGPVESKRQKVWLVVNVRPEPASARTEAPSLQCPTDAIRMRDISFDQFLEGANLLNRFGTNLSAPHGRVEELHIEFASCHQLPRQAIGVLAHTGKRRKQRGAVECETNRFRFLCHSRDLKRPIQPILCSRQASSRRTRLPAGANEVDIDVLEVPFGSGATPLVVNSMRFAEWCAGLSRMPYLPDFAWANEQSRHHLVGSSVYREALACALADLVANRSRFHGSHLQLGSPQGNETPERASPKVPARSVVHCHNCHAVKVRSR